ncbi:cytochrome b/b6 domain-containing protein [Vibrio lentus]|uniref:Cytochrome b561 bacterial/Ni-hydrogenase domain-containing protein n=1 Tax=Vibrio lentus TaxID=136468 RepID=A0A2N7KAQ4_9VIBR|nr:cytochrome b/b6 domain-containing protein [Vibrio lentus]PMM71980.1 hypothetical protein BCT49_00300 [Vibrio lentus]
MITKKTIILHWISGFTFIGLFALGLYMIDLPSNPEKYEWYDIHKSVGFLFMFFAAFRLIHRIKEGWVTSREISSWEYNLAIIVHALLIIFTLLIPISGVLMSGVGGYGVNVFGVVVFPKGIEISWLYELSSQIHHSMVEPIVFLVVLHVVGALKHQFFSDTRSISRMIGR